MRSLIYYLAGYKTYKGEKAIYTRPRGANPSSEPFHSLIMNDLGGKPFDFAQLKGKKTLIVNTASECKFTAQYAGLEKFYLEHKDRLNILGFPCNDFGAQEKGSSADIHAFCMRNYGVSFPMFEKISINQGEIAPVYKWLSTKSLNGWCKHIPHWNFCKYLVDEKGELLLFTNPVAEPGDLLQHL